MASTILIIEGDRTTLDMLSATLKTQGFNVIGAKSAAKALSSAKMDKPDLIILSLGVSDFDGEKICRELRGDKTSSDIPLLVLTPDAEDDVHYLTFGADAVICDPGPDRLIGYCHKLLQRFETPKVITMGKMRVDGRTRTVHFGNREWSQFTPKEFDLLYFLADRAGKPVSQAKLYEKIWEIKLPPGAENILRTVDTHILRLRNTLKKELGVRNWIVNKPKCGYMIVVP